ncbi:response regulator transcription factor [Acidovorax sp. SUPP2522]|uniref:response regulator transcription factor n=1 Tax=unclassified Acidovorax TaxID=2684926 RepID=UPI00234AA3C4|nr:MULTISPECIES: response regulator transcription factor [unclassified Acidovorax]WCM96629.1 response regulator transcription factor [Acidovorax sp. GBBC 1281]GKT19272.1 response regulator transcription factor [Acidovorax sp. SUPP2522]
MRVLIIEDDRRTAAYLVRALRESGRVADHAADGATGLAMAREGIYDAIVLDRMLSCMDGLAVVRVLRGLGLHLPVLMLSALGSVQHRVEGLQAGCDDYLTKPYAFIEVLARLDRLLARTEPLAEGLRLAMADLELDVASRVVARAGQRVDLSTSEFLLLERLMRHAGQVISRQMLLESAWDYDFEPPDHLIDRHMHRLRKKVDGGHAEMLIHSVRGAGYRMGPPADGRAPG